MIARPLSSRHLGNNLFATVNKEKLWDGIGYKPHEGQRLVHASNKPRRILACGSRWGKTTCAAAEGLASGLAPRDRSYGWIVAPYYGLTEKVFREMAFILKERAPSLIVECKNSSQEKKIVMHNLGGGVSEIVGKTADNPDSLIGEGLDWLIIDEAARIKPEIYYGHLSQRLLDREGWALLISTPKGKGWFYEEFRRGIGSTPDPAYKSWNAPTWQNPHVNKALIDAEKTRIPERVFKQEYAGEFVEGAGQVFRRVRDVASLECIDTPSSGEIYVAGIDLAKTTDFTVVVVMDSKRRVVAFDRFNKIDWSLQTQRIKAIFERFGVSVGYVDSTGLGEPVYEGLLHADIPVEGYKLTQASKSAAIDNLAMLFDTSAIQIPRPDIWPELIDELEAFEYSVTEKGNVSTGAPAGQHDDCVIALALAAWPLRPTAILSPQAF